ncbi:hypothetical protein [Photorhabdus bodei]|uniref:hypothetical protein n=1 Tax=Photorhabdus bodei TaxID=2029681 RepID=UPI001E5FBC85|nr:hypothetical protein [Photorhabdus bodei]MCC8463958.1 hypothetical protein [Photorhabdus bodei]
MTGVSESSQQRSNLKDNGYIYMACAYFVHSVSAYNKRQILIILLSKYSASGEVLTCHVKGEQ